MAELITQQAIEDAVQAQVRGTLALLDTLRTDLLQRLSAAEGFEASRLGELLTALDDGILRFRTDYAALLEDGQRALIALGTDLVNGAVTTAGLTVLAPDVTQSLLNTLSSTRLELVTRISANLQADLAREIQLGVLGVKPPYEVIQQVQALLDTAGATSYAARAETITRTEVGRAQSQATQEHLEIAERQGVKVLKEWRHSGLARNARSTHVAATGQRKPVREPFLVGGVALMYPRDPAAPPSATVNCFPGDTVVWTPGILGAIRSWYEGALVEIETAQGYQLAGTPNHPVLTVDGFVPLGELVKGSSIFSSRSCELARLPELDIKDSPALLQQIYNALAVKGMRVSMQGVDVNLYGRVPCGEVDIVYPCRELGNGIHAQLTEPLRKLRLAFANLRERFLLTQRLSMGSLLEKVRRFLPESFVGSSCQMPAFFRRSLIHPQLLCCTTPSNDDAFFDEASPDDGPRNVVELSQSFFRRAGHISPGDFGAVERMPCPSGDYASLRKPPVDNFAVTGIRRGNSRGGFASLIASDHIVKVSIRDNYSGHVYSLQTYDGVYIANGIVASNCRCIATPYIEV